MSDSIQQMSEVVIPDGIGQDHPKKKAMLEALVSTLGVVTTACKRAQIARSTHYEWLESDPSYKEAVEGVGDLTLDFTETQLHTLIKEKNPAAIFFHLKTKGKKRGYIERQEIESENTHNIQGNVHLFLPDNGRDPHLTQGKIEGSSE
tara:strand:+ start:545 stop:988 length:444 start_codon:yes stop_codon:yes gene_type:complete